MSHEGERATATEYKTKLIALPLIGSIRLVGQVVNDNY